VKLEGDEMLAFIARRLSVLVVILFGSSFIIYNLAAISGDPVEDLRFSDQPEAKLQLEKLTLELKLDVPPPLRYFMWLRSVLGVFIGKPDFGMSREGYPVIEELAGAIPVTLRLVFMATLIAIVLGISLGIVTALRQYGRFDYSVTFMSFLLFSLPIFWVAVLLKEYMAISFNNFLLEPKVPITWALALSLVAALFWASAIGGNRKRFWSIFAIAGLTNAFLLQLLSWLDWFSTPQLGPIVLTLMSAGIAIGITALSTGLDNKSAMRAALTMSGASLIAYYPTQYFFNTFPGALTLIALLMFTLFLSFVVTNFFAKVDKGPVLRTAMLTGVLTGVLFILDRLMQSWVPYVATDAVNGRPVPTAWQINTQLYDENPDYWINLLDIAMHLILPTIALTLISFAGYVRYSRGTLLEVLNQDYIRTARAKGLNERTVVMRHAFRNTMIPISQIIVWDFAGLIGGAIITERVFGWQGMGTLVNKAIVGVDLNLLMAVFFVTSTLALLANLAADILYSYLDPRIRIGGN
jgi:peptide/nickel transport system permease protein